MREFKYGKIMPGEVLVGPEHTFRTLDPAAESTQFVVWNDTHDFGWMPAKAGQPIGQLIGGGPHPKYATIIHGAATRKQLTLKMSKLDGTVVAEVKIEA